MQAIFLNIDKSKYEFNISDETSIAGVSIKDYKRAMREIQYSLSQHNIKRAEEDINKLHSRGVPASIKTYTW
jgi:hypothetical protein